MPQNWRPQAAAAPGRLKPPRSRTRRDQLCESRETAGLDTAAYSVLCALIPVAPEQAIHGGVGHLTIHDKALSEEPFLREPESFKEAC